MEAGSLLRNLRWMLKGFSSRSLNFTRFKRLPVDSFLIFFFGAAQSIHSDDKPQNKPRAKSFYYSNYSFIISDVLL